MNEDARKEGIFSLCGACLVFVLFGVLFDDLVFHTHSSPNFLYVVFVIFIGLLGFGAASSAFDQLIKVSDGHSLKQKNLKTQRIYRFLTQNQISPGRTIVVALDADDKTTISFETRLPIPACTHFRVGDKPEDITPLNVSTVSTPTLGTSGQVATA